MSPSEWCSLCPQASKGNFLPHKHSEGTLPEFRERLHTPHHPSEAARQRAVQNKASDRMKENEGSDLCGKMALQRGEIAYTHKRELNNMAVGGARRRIPIMVTEGKA